MARTRRTQILMEPGEFRHLRSLARQRKTSIAQLVREAVRKVYLEPSEPENRQAIVERMLSMNLPTIEWADAKKEIEDAHAEADIG
ncbi:MAG: hypothetical protein ACRD5F_14915 [Candidatus Acidiferrales bacterium]